MPLTLDDIGRIDANADTKGDLEDSLSEHAREYPDFEEIDSDTLTREEMLEAAKAAIQKGISDQGKTDAVKKLLDKQPESVIVPVTQAFMMLTHPKQKEEPIRITVYSDMGWSTRDSARPDPRDPEEDPEINQLQIQSTALQELPDWALPKIYDLAIAGDIRIFPNHDAAQKAVETQVRRTEPILDDPSVTPGYEYRRDGNAYADEADQPLVAEPTARFRKPAQRVAWNVLNSVVDQDPPLPQNPSEVSTDPNNLTEAEKSRVERRIKTALESPERYARKARRESFDKRAFFDQLLELEMSGYNAPRSGDQDIGRVTRPEVIAKIREIADAHGFEVVGDFVREKPDTNLAQEGRVPETTPMTPESQRRNEPTTMGSAHRGNRRKNEDHLG